MKSIFIMLLTTACLIACESPEESFISHSEYRDRLEGKYLIYESRAEYPVDVNQDGQPSENLFLEYHNFDRLYAHIRILESMGFDPYYRFRPPNMWIEIAWEEQIITDYYQPGDEEYYSPYKTASQSSVWYFDINREFTELNLHDPEIPREPSNRWTQPDEVFFNDEGLLVITMDKPLYLPSGWDTVKITTKYIRE